MSTAQKILETKHALNEQTIAWLLRLLENVYKFYYVHSNEQTICVLVVVATRTDAHRMWSLRVCSWHSDNTWQSQGAKLDASLYDVELDVSVYGVELAPRQRRAQELGARDADVETC